MRAGLDLEELLPALNAMEGYGTFIAVSDAGISVIVGKVFYYEFLTDVYCLVDVLAVYVYQLYCELTGTHS